MANSQVSERMSDDAGKPGLQKTFARTYAGLGRTLDWTWTGQVMNKIICGDCVGYNARHARRIRGFDSHIPAVL